MEHVVLCTLAVKDLGHAPGGYATHAQRAQVHQRSAAHTENSNNIMPFAGIRLLLRMYL